MVSPVWTQSSFGKKASAWLPRLGLSAPTLTCHWAWANRGMIKTDSANVQRNVAENLVKLKAIIVPPKGSFFAGNSS
jgi:hypothetical protein